MRQQPKGKLTAWKKNAGMSERGEFLSSRIFSASRVSTAPVIGTPGSGRRWTTGYSALQYLVTAGTRARALESSACETVTCGKSRVLVGKTRRT